MSTRSLRVHPDWVEAVRHAYQSRYVRQKDLAEDAEISSVDTVNRFLNGKPVSRENFWRLCGLLELSWEIVTNSISASENIEPPSVEVNQDTSLFPSQKQVESKLSSTTLENPNFIGREQEIGYLRHLNNQGYTCILLLAPGGVGKTTLARSFLKREFSTYIEFSIAKEQKNIASAANLVEEKLRQLNEEPGREFYISLERIKYKLQTQKMGVLVDNLEPALDGQGRFLDQYRDYVDLLRVLCDPSLKSVTIITSREPIYESLDIHLLLLNSLNIEDWKTYFYYRDIEVNPLILSEIHEAYNGNALAMKILSEVIKQYYSNSIVNYWQNQKIGKKILVEKAVENLIKEQFNHLEKVNSEAYKLLCRMGCCRYQDVSTVPVEGLLSLLWDVKQDKNQLINFLSRCSLVEYKEDEYWLHPIIRAEAIFRLKASEDWEITNCKIAEFWTEKISCVEVLEDAIKAFEAYYHYLEIGDFERAASVIVKERDNNRVAAGPLGRSFFRLGLLQQMIAAINRIIGLVKNELYLAKLYNILGDLHWMVGFINEAINYHSQSGIIVDNFIDRFSKVEDENLRLEVRRLRYSYLLNMGLCNLDLAQIEEAKGFFEQLLSESSNDCHGKHGEVSACFCLAFINSYSGQEEKAIDFVQKSQHHLEQGGMGSWTTGYGFIFLGLTYGNLGFFEKSFEMYYKAIDFAEMIHYSQVKAKATSNIAILYRKQGNFNQSISKHLEAIQLLKKLGAKSDLAEAYFQLALTYRVRNESTKSWEYRDKAVQLFTEMEAPKQVDRVIQNFSKAEN